jgi:tetratricopeptide (TPR) repeat protein
MSELVKERSHARSRFAELLETWRLPQTDPEPEPDQGLPLRPYPGLRSFLPSESQLFFGRNNQVQELRRRFVDSNAVLVMGGSGSGKSSLVKAGLLPSLKTVAPVPNRLGRWYVAECRPRTSPSAEVVEALWRDVCDPLFNDDAGREALAAGFDDCTIEGGQVLASREACREKFGALVERRAASGRGSILDHYGISEFANVVLDTIDDHLLEHLRAGNANLLIFIDQFEEIFDDNKIDPESRDAVFALIDLARRNRGQALFVILTMRSEALHRCAEDPRLVDLVNQSSFLLELIDQQEVPDAIVGPARTILQAWGILPFEGRPSTGASPFTPSLVATLSEELAHLRSNLGHKPDSLPLLQHTLEAIWSHALERWAGPIRDGADAGEFSVEEQDFDAVCNPTVREAGHDSQFLSAGPFRYCLNARADECRAAAAKILEQTAAVSPEMAQRILAAAFSTLARRDDHGNWVREFASSADMLATSGVAQARGLKAGHLIEALRPFVEAGYLQIRRSAKQDRLNAIASSESETERASDVTAEYCVGHEALIRGWSWCGEQLRKSENLRRLLARLDIDLATRRDKVATQLAGSRRGPAWRRNLAAALGAPWRWLLAESEKDAARLVDRKQRAQLQHDLFSAEPVFSRTWALNCLTAHRREISRRQEGSIESPGAERRKTWASITEQEALDEIVKVIKEAHHLPRARWRLPSAMLAVGSVAAAFICNVLLYEARLRAETEVKERLSAVVSTATPLAKEEAAGHITTGLKSALLEPNAEFFWTVYVPFKSHLRSIRSPEDMQRGHDLLRLSETLVETYVNQGQVDKLVAMSAAQRELAGAFVASNANRVSQRDRYKSMKSTGRAKRMKGNPEAALGDFQAFLEGMTELVGNDPLFRNDPTVPAEWYKDLADAFEAVGDMRATTGSESLPAYEKLLDLAEKRRTLSEGDDALYWDWKAAAAHENIGDIHRLQGDTHEALYHYLKFENIMDGLVGVDRYNLIWQRSDALSHERVGDMRRALAEATSDLGQASNKDDFIRAEEEYQNFSNIMESIQAYDSSNVEFRRLKTHASERKGDLLALQAFEAKQDHSLFARKVAEARREYERELEIVSELVKERPKNSDFERDLLIVKEKLGDLLILEGKPADAREMYGSVEKTLTIPDPHDLDRVRDVQLVHERVADAYLQEGKRADAMREFDICAKMKSEVLFDPRTGLLYDENDKKNGSTVRKRFGERSDVQAYCVKRFGQIASLAERVIPADACAGRTDGPQRCR